MPSLGMLRIDPVTALAFPSIAIPQPAGRATLSAFMPQNSGLVGATIHAQALWVQGATVRLTNATADLVLP